MSIFRVKAAAKVLSPICLFIFMSVCVLADTPTPPAAPPPDLTAHKTKDGVLFQCIVPGGGATVYLAGDFNTWANNTASVVTDAQFKMDGPDANGLYTKVVKIDPGAHKFKFVINGTWTTPDWVKERDTDDNGIFYVIASGDVFLKNPVNPDWKPTLKDGKVTFQFCAPAAKSVYLAGDFNNWGNVKNDTVSDASCAMQGPDANGVWQTSVTLSPGSHSYKFVINGNQWANDPNADKQDSQNNSVTDAAVAK